MGVPKRLASVAEVIEDCTWWRITHTRLPFKYNGTRYVTTCECTNPNQCGYKTDDPRIGNCQISGNVAKIPKEERP